MKKKKKNSKSKKEAGIKKMDNFKAVYKILSVLEKSMDLEEVNT